MVDVENVVDETSDETIAASSGDDDIEKDRPINEVKIRVIGFINCSCFL